MLATEYTESTEGMKNTSQSFFSVSSVISVAINHK